MGFHANIFFQYSNGGPIIAFQVENEYGSYGSDSDYMEYLKQVILSEVVYLLCHSLDLLNRRLSKTPMDTTFCHFRYTASGARLVISCLIKI